jgi:hypothetical protein
MITCYRDRCKAAKVANSCYRDEVKDLVPEEVRREIMRRVAAERERHREDRPCAVCGTLIPGAFGRRLYCSARCRKRAQREREQGSAPAAPETVTPEPTAEMPSETGLADRR